MTLGLPYLVEISLKRVQGFIFDVPRLKAMLGANALVGETMRNGLVRLAEEAMALEYKLPEGVAAPQNDPLDHPVVSVAERDDPAELYRKGILARDGGHFIAVFPTHGTAQRFIDSATLEISERLPGVLFDVVCREIGSADERGPAISQAVEAHPAAMPSFQICQETGREPASPADGHDLHGRFASDSVQARLEAGSRHYRGETRDIIGLLRGALRQRPDSGWEQPDDLADMCGGQYLAVIHADGNQVGKRYKEWRTAKSSGGNTLDAIIHDEAVGESFFHSMRVAVRRAVVSALESAFATSGGVRPYQVLMLGGDDLLLACRADRALAFCRAYAETLAEIPLADGRPLDVGMGVAIAAPSYPFHRLHELAEALGASAKRLYRSLDTKDRGSVADWQVVTQSWFGDPGEQRQRSECVRYRTADREELLYLTARPYRMLPTADRSGASLAELAEASRFGNSGDGNTRAGRSALRGMRAAIETGRSSAELAWRKLPPATRQDLGGQLWEELGDGAYLTRVLDIIGLQEIDNLGSGGE